MKSVIFDSDIKSSTYLDNDFDFTDIKGSYISYSDVKRVDYIDNSNVDRVYNIQIVDFDNDISLESSPPMPKLIVSHENNKLLVSSSK